MSCTFQEMPAKPLLNVRCGNRNLLYVIWWSALCKAIPGSCTSRIQWRLESTEVRRILAELFLNQHFYLLVVLTKLWKHAYLIWPPNHKLIRRVNLYLKPRSTIVSKSFFNRVSYAQQTTFEIFPFVHRFLKMYSCEVFCFVQKKKLHQSRFSLFMKNIQD